jgi:hypothetical protein
VENDVLGRHVIARLVSKLGIPETARRLRVRDAMILRFVDGTVPVPDVLLVMAFDLVVEDIRGTMTPLDGEVGSTEESKPD